MSAGRDKIAILVSKQAIQIGHMGLLSLNAQGKTFKSVTG